MDVFNKKDQVQIMTGNAALGGLGGLIGFFLSSSLPVLALPGGLKILPMIKKENFRICNNSRNKYFLSKLI